MDSRTKKTFLFVFLTLFVDLLAFTLILPLLPRMLDYYAINDKSGAYNFYDKNLKTIQGVLGVPDTHNQVLLAGVLGSWFSLLQFISSPFLGALSDEYGRKSMLLMSMSGSVVSYAIWLTAGQSFGLFILSRTIGGLSKANVGLSLAVVSDVSDETSRGRGMAIVGSSFSLAFIFGPLLGAYLSTKTRDIGYQSQLIVCPALIALTLSIVNVALVAMLLEETNIRRKKDKRKYQPPQSNLSRNESTLTKAFHYINPKSLLNFSLIDNNNPQRNNETHLLKTTGLIYFQYLLFYSGLEFTLSFLTHIRFGFSSMDQGKLYLFSGLIMALIQGGYVRSIKSGSEPMIALIGLSLIIPAFIWMGIATKVAHIYQSLTMYAISSAIVVPCLTTIISSHSPVESRGVVMGTFRSIGSLARAIGPALASIIFWTLGPTACYISGALALTLPLYLLKKSYNQMQGLDSGYVINLSDKKHSSKFHYENLAKAH